MSPFFPRVPPLACRQPHSFLRSLIQQHALVPGCTYLTFLLDILNFLSTHPSEIVVVELKSDGFIVREDKLHEGKVAVYSMIPAPAELDEVWEEARKLAEADSAREIVRGGPEDMSRPIGELIKERKRVILVDQVHQPGCWVRGDSYGESISSSHLFAERAC